MSFEIPLRLQRESQGSVAYTNPNVIPGTTTPFAGGRNGVSIDGAGFAVLGNDVGATSATLISNREIPMAGFGILFSGIGNTATGILTTRDDAARALLTPQWQFLDSSSREIGKISFYSALPTLFGTIAIGRAAGAANNTATSNSTYIGFDAGNVHVGNNTVAIGGKAMELVTAGNQNTAVGANALGAFTGGALGDNNTAVGYQAGYVLGVAAARNSMFGRDAGGGMYLGSADNVCIGFQTGLFFTAIARAYSQNVLIGSATLRLATQDISTNNVVIGYGCLNVSANGLTGGCTLIGALITSTVATVGNSSVFGQGINIDISNVCVIGRGDQNIMIGKTNANAGSDLGSKLQVFGSAAYPINTTAVNLTLDATMYTVIVTAGAVTITLPAAASSTNRIYVIVNQAAAGTITSYTGFAGAGVTVLAANAAIALQSNGAAWIRIL
jgi:hypothetical protein